MDRNRHMASHTTPTPQDEALRRSVAADLGPRRPGAIYTTPDGELHTVVDVITDRAEARLATGSRSAQFAVLTIRRVEKRPTEKRPGVELWTLYTTAEPWNRANVLHSLGTSQRDPR